MKKFISMIPVIVVLFLISAPALAAGDASAAGSNDWKGYVGIGAALAIGLSAFGCGLGQGRACAAALEGIARNPNASDKIFTPMIIGLALIESLVIYALVIAFILQGKV